MKRWLWIGLIGCLCPAVLHAADHSVILQEDQSYEAMLRYENGPDHIVTPARVIHALFGSKTAAYHPSNTEFQPVVNVHQTKVLVVAAVAYKF